MKLLTNRADSLLNLSFSEAHLRMKDYAKEHNVPIIQDEGLAFIETIIKITNSKKILEIGTAIGYCASYLQKISNGFVVTIEKDDVMYDEALKNIIITNQKDQIKIIKGDALTTFDSIKDQKFDFIFIDAAKGQYQKFFEIYEPLLNDNGIIACDNMFFHGLLDQEVQSRSLRSLIRKINNFHDFLLNNPNYDTKIFNIGDGISISVKK